jgi:hypothetical protein
MHNLHPMTKEQKANPLGAHLLNHYYTNQSIKTLEQKKFSHPVFTLNSPKDLPLIMHCARQEGLSTYGIVVVSGGRHRTPIMIDNNRAFVFESLGTSKSKVGINSVAQVALALNHSEVPLDSIYTFRDNRQVDSQSCGSDSFIALKEAFRIKDKLNDFVENEAKATLKLNNDSIIDKEEKSDAFFMGGVEVVQLKNLPPEIAKYSQTQSAIESYDYRSTTLADPSFNQENHSPETVSQYAKKYLRVSSIPLSDKKPVQLGNENIELKSRKLIFSNSALEKRRIKHDALLTRMASTLSESEIKDIIKESSGINLISRHLNDIPDSLLQDFQENDESLPIEANDKTSSRDELIEDYITEEMLKRRDEKTGVAPKGSCSLTELAEKMKHAPSDKPGIKAQ